MTVIKNWEPAENSVDWQDVVRDAEGTEDALGARCFTLWRKLTSHEREPLEDLDECVACRITMDDEHIIVDRPLVQIVHRYLDSLPHTK